MAYSFQTFSVGEVLTATKMNQVEVNVRDHVHGTAGVANIANDYITSDMMADRIRDVTVQTVVNTAAETTVFSETLKANVMGTDKMLVLTLLASHLNHSVTNRTLTLRVKYGTTTIATLVVNPVNDPTYTDSHFLLLRVYWSMRNTPNLSVAISTLSISDRITTGGYDSGGLVGAVVSASKAFTEGTTSDKTLAITLQHEIASTGLVTDVLAVQVQIF